LYSTTNFEVIGGPPQEDIHTGARKQKLRYSYVIAEDIPPKMKRTIDNRCRVFVIFSISYCFYGLLINDMDWNL
jgi:hypothetical protein